MYKITKEMCLAFLKEYYISKILIRCSVVLIAWIALLFRIENLITRLVITAILLGLTVVVIIGISKKIKRIQFGDMYLTEDVVVHYKKRLGNTGFHLKRRYVYTFKEYGKFSLSKSVAPTVEIPLHKENSIRRSAIEDLSTQYCCSGDVFYLLITEVNNRQKIIMAFPQNHFDVLKNDFECVEGKYYPKPSTV